MLLRRIALATCAVLTLSAGAFAADPADKCPTRPGFALFTPEVRMMMMADLRAQADNGAIDVEVLRQMQRDKMRAMTDDQRKAYADGLTKRWNALTPAAQEKLKADAKAWRDSHPHPEGRPGCPPPAAH